MSDSAIQDVLTDMFALQKKQSNDIVEIKTCLLGDDYHTLGLVDRVTRNDNCINTIKQKLIPDIEIALEKRASKIEIQMEKRSGVIGGVIGLVTILGTTIANWFIFGK